MAGYDATVLTSKEPLPEEVLSACHDEPPLSYVTVTKSRPAFRGWSCQSFQVFVPVHPARLLLMKNIGLVMLLLWFGGCSARDPDPSPLFDGHYLGTRHSDRADACGISGTDGTTSARVTQGHLTMPLFGPGSQLSGTVGDDGRVRASGIWPNPTGGFPGVTVLNGLIKNEQLDGTASDFRCRTDLRLHKITPPPARPVSKRSP